jgi:hypothetical protein
MITREGTPQHPKMLQHGEAISLREAQVEQSESIVNAGRGLGGGFSVPCPIDDIGRVLQRRIDGASEHRIIFDQQNSHRARVQPTQSYATTLRANLAKGRPRFEEKAHHLRGGIRIRAQSYRRDHARLDLELT